MSLAELTFELGLIGRLWSSWGSEMFKGFTGVLGRLNFDFVSIIPAFSIELIGISSSTESASDIDVKSFGFLGKSRLTSCDTLLRFFGSFGRPRFTISLFGIDELLVGILGTSTSGLPSRGGGKAFVFLGCSCCIL